MGIAIELPETIKDFHDIASQRLSTSGKRNKMNYKARIKIISNIIADLIIHFLQKTGKIQEMLEEIQAKRFV